MDDYIECITLILLFATSVFVRFVRLLLVNQMVKTILRVV